MKLSPGYSVVGNYVQHRLPKDAFGKVRGEPAHDSLEAFGASGFWTVPGLWTGIGISWHLKSSAEALARASRGSCKVGYTVGHWGIMAKWAS